MSKELKKISDVKVFGKWATAGLEAADPGLKRYISSSRCRIPHPRGRHAHHRSSNSTIDIAPQRRVDIALRHISDAARQASHNNPRTIDESLADELVLASARDPKSLSVKKRDEIERIALASR